MHVWVCECMDAPCADNYVVSLWREARCSSLAHRILTRIPLHTPANTHSHAHIQAVHKDRLLFLLSVEGEVTPQVESRAHQMIDCL
jgi:hypothetical protein